MGVSNETQGDLLLGCEGEVQATLKSGKDVYPHRPDLHALPFWECPTCKNFVGCHHKTKNKFDPLGCIPTPAVKEERKRLHALMDPLWREGLIGRSELYARMGKVLGYTYHTAHIRSVEEGQRAYTAAEEIEQDLRGNK